MSIEERIYRCGLKGEWADVALMVTEHVTLANKEFALHEMADGTEMICEGNL